MKRSVRGVAATLVALFLISCTTSKGSFFLVNKTKESIARASVTVCGQTINLKDIQPNTSVAGSFEVKCTGGYIIQVEFQSGKTLRKETGYVMSELDSHDVIVVTDSDIEIPDSTAIRSRLPGPGKGIEGRRGPVGVARI